MSGYPTPSAEAVGLEPGLYEHYKGILCRVIGVSYHSETYEELVVYQKVKDNSLWVRPLKMFLEEVVVNNQIIPRFKKI